MYLKYMNLKTGIPILSVEFYLIKATHYVYFQENEGQFVDKDFKLPSPFKDIQNENLYAMFWFGETEQEMVARAGSFIRYVLIIVWNIRNSNKFF